MKLSVVIPAYNEEKRITETLRDVNSYLSKQDYDYEIVVVVNGSHDRTYDVVKNLENGEIKKAVAVNLKEGGKGNAVKRGILDSATGDVIMFMDADNATPISEMEKFLPYFKEGYDVVIGSRELNPELVKKPQGFLSHTLGKFSHGLIRFMLLPGIYDSQTGYKAFSKKAAKDIFQYVTINRWGFDMEVLKIAMVRGYKIKEVGVLWTEHGGGHVPLSAYAESFTDLLKIRMKAMQGDYGKKADLAKAK